MPEPTGVPAPLLNRFGFLIYLCFEHLWQDATAELTQAGYLLTPRHISILVAVSDPHSRLNQQSLARILCVHRNVMVKIIDKLEKEGLVMRVANPENRREHIIELTDTGRVMMKRTTAVMDRVIDNILAVLSSDEKNTMMRLAQRLALSAVGD